MHTAQQPAQSGFGPHSTAHQVIEGIDLHGKIAVVTGGYAGLGIEVVKALASAGASVVVPARDDDRARRALADIAGVELDHLDLAHTDSIDRFADRLLGKGRPIDILVNNAGIMAVPLDRDRRGLETHLAVNYLSHFQLTSRLWPALTAGSGARVVSLTSRAYRFSEFNFDDPNFHDRDYDKWAAYGQSMTAKAQFAVELDARGQQHGVRAFAVHPGTIMTGLSRHLSRAELVAMGTVDINGTYLAPAGYKTVAQGAATTVWAATSPLLDGRGGVYLEDCDVAPLVDSSADLFGAGVDPWLIDPSAAAHLWEFTERLLGQTLPAPSRQTDGGPFDSAAGAKVGVR